LHNRRYLDNVDYQMASSPATRSRRLSRQEHKARTRERLIAAARAVFAKRGFHRASLEEIAEEAGHSTGAVYSNFAGKEDLFLAVLDDHIAKRLEAVDAAVARATSPADRARAGAQNWMEFLSEDPDWYPLFIEFWAYALRDPQLRPRVAKRFAAFPRANARLLREGLRESGVALTDDVAEGAGLLLTALSDGLALIKVMDPDAVPDDLFGDAMTFLLDRVR
jgi:AcrR family transcriptional regulator